MFSNFHVDNAAPFALPDDIWDLPRFCKDTDDQSTFLFSNIFDRGQDVRVQPLPPLDKEAAKSLFEASPFNFSLGTSEPQPAAPETILPVEDTDDGASEHSQDFWLDPQALEAPSQPHFLTWDSFLIDSTPVNPYLAEAAPRAFDAVLAKHLDDIYSPNESGSVVRSDLFCYCLLHLALGQDSVLFKFNEKGHRFEAVRENLRTSGTTIGLSESIITEFSECGRDLRKLQRFSAKVYKDYAAVNPFTVALAECVNTAVNAVQQRITDFAGTVASVMQLQDVVRDPALVLHCFAQVVRLTEVSNEQHVLLSRMFELVQKLEYRNGWLRPLLLRMFSRVSTPWLGVLSDWVGLGNNKSGLPGDGVIEHLFVKDEEVVQEEGEQEMQIVFDAERVPTFMNVEDAQTMFETGRALRVLEKCRPDHPLLQPEEKPHFEWKFSWEDLERVQAQANSYEASIRRAIKIYNTGNTPISTAELQKQAKNSDCGPYGFAAEEIASQLSTSLAEMNFNPSAPSDSLYTTILSITSANVRDGLTAYAPPMSITPILSFSHILTVQSRITNAATMRLFFHELDMRKHLSLLYRFQLFGDGVFVSRLSHGLFDDEMDTAERGEGGVSGGVMGLKLGSRDTWPPASSELRLALAGILTDCYRPNTNNTESTGAYTHRKDDLPGGLSFIVRDMSEEELKRCMDPNSIEALDFLRLRYRPPSPLNAVITASTLYKYDKLFKLLLRVVRMLFVMNRLFRDMTSRTSAKWTHTDPTAQKMRIEAHHFVSSIGKYFFEAGIAVTWKRFEEKLDELENSSCGDDGVESLGRLLEYHERVLDQMLFATLSRKRQLPIMKIVDEIFSIILTFARYVRARSVSSAFAEETFAYGEGGPSVFIAKLHTRFRKRVAIFISVCRGLSEKRGYGDGKAASKRDVDSVGGSQLFKSGDTEEGGMLGQLLVKLEMTGYYTMGVGKAAVLQKTPVRDAGMMKDEIVL